MNIVDTEIELIYPEPEDQVYKVLEICGRVAYKSEEKITTESAIPFIRGLIKRGHESVLEHRSVTVRITTDRATANALVRHRIAAYTQESTIYCNYTKGNKPGLNVRTPFFLTRPATLTLWREAMARAESYYNALIMLGVPPKQARDVLPLATKTELIATHDMRGWRHVIRERMVPGDSDGIHLVMAKILGRLKALYPILFEDIEISTSCWAAIEAEESSYNYKRDLSNGSI